jgi:hypothetical protein
MWRLIVPVGLCTALAGCVLSVDAVVPESQARSGGLKASLVG